MEPLPERMSSGGVVLRRWIESDVEIHRDKANAASGGVPARLGYTLLGEWDDEPLAPADVGIECRWAVSRDEWCDHEPTTVL
jgi:RimJ/RimL family protein N-acetyltransferase